MSSTAFRSLVGAALLFATVASAPAAAQHDDIVETAVAAGSFNTLAAALDAAGLIETLKGDGPFTVFAPTDEAFAALPAGTVESLLEPGNRDALISILTYHVVPGRVTAEQVVELDRATTVNGAEVRISATRSGVRINDSNVITTDVLASNGVIHVIDQVLLPPETETAGAEPMSRRERRDARSAMDLMALAIDRGVPLFNDGHVGSTAAIYEIATRSVLAGNLDLPRTVTRALERGVAEAERTHDLRDRAWVYRGAMDRALDALEGRMRMAVRDRH
ncbi:MAG: fasciclin domain-containing protein [Gemmatimonadetes bacterium]|nr:fasciclin domain-containing protein [Gemmatimonadota bacterium]